MQYPRQLTVLCSSPSRTWNVCSNTVYMILPSPKEGSITFGTTSSTEKKIEIQLTRSLKLYIMHCGSSLNNLLTLKRSLLFFFFFFKDFIYLFMRERKAETQPEGEAGSTQGAQRGTQSRVSRIRPWAEGSAKLLSHLGCPHRPLLVVLSFPCSLGVRDKGSLHQPRCKGHRALPHE